MKIFDCFMYFDEELVLDVRLNTLDKYVDYFVIVESKFTHKGEKRNLKFNHEKFKKFENKLIYLAYDKKPKEVEIINDTDADDIKGSKYIMNAVYRENSQRNFIKEGLNQANDEDIIMISDVDEIPDLININFKNIKEKIIMFQQSMFYYKFDLKIPDLLWTGTKACKKKYFISPQWLRNVKDKKYSFFRPDIIFSEKKYHDIKFINPGGWHFSNIKSAEDIEYKLKSYLHHREFDVQPLSANEIKKIIEKKQALYDLRVDKRVNKIGNGSKLVKFDFEQLPIYIQENKNLFKQWLD